MRESSQPISKQSGLILQPASNLVCELEFNENGKRSSRWLVCLLEKCTCLRKKGTVFGDARLGQKQLHAFVRKSFPFDDAELFEEIHLVIDYPCFYNLSFNYTPDSNNCV